MTKQEKIEQAVKALNALRNRVSGGWYDEPSEVTQRLNFNKDTEVSFDIRYWGEWINPEEARYEEDYDWKILSPESRERLDELVKEFEERYNVSILAMPEEKCWISFRTIIKEEK